ncbi:MAG: ABC-type multidrug transport system, ATPase component [Acidobacteria bacterium]|nr:ABC-type multidrug transport system, ATPase component [Acidobacteriota bacterium]
MRIVLAEEQNGQRNADRAFDSAIVEVGRDRSVCQIVFDNEKWPMVSRRHAEFRLQAGRCLLVDNKSRFGTFLDGRQITEVAQVQVGSRVQFGAGGPTLYVVRLEQSSSPQIDIPPFINELRQPAYTPEPVLPEKPEPRAAASAFSKRPSAFLDLVSEVTGEFKRCQLDKEITRLGRGLDMDVRIDADVAVVSRHHAAIEHRAGQFKLIDQESFNGTLLNQRRLIAPAVLRDGDHIQLGMGGPVFRFHGLAFSEGAGGQSQPTIHSLSGSVQSDRRALPDSSGQQLLSLHRSLAGGAPVTIGRAVDNDIKLDGLQISNHHARVTLIQQNVVIEDVGSTNGVYVNGTRITGKTTVRSSDTVQIGPFLIQLDPERGLDILDTRSKTRIDAVDITKIVPNRAGGGTVKLLDDVDLVIQPNEFVGLLGPSGAGKSTLMDSLNGMRPATEGQVLINNQDLYQHLDSLKQSIGYVPQDDIIHRELTVYRTLYYVARLRLSRDVSTAEIEQIVNEVMDVTGLSERRDVAVGQLSGGQRKRVSIAVELVTKPSIIFLDEPTSGLDPATEEKIMKLFRQIAESGRTVILTTHAMENVKLFDKIVVMMRGKLVFYGAPQEALAHIHADSFKDLYDKLEAPIEAGISKLPPLPANASAAQKRDYKLQREHITEAVAEDWKQRFLTTRQYKENIQQHLGGLKGNVPPVAPARRRPTVTDALGQWKTLAQRYMEVLRHDKFNLLILFGQAPIVALLTWLVVDNDSPRDFPYFVLALVAVWFGTSIAAREIIKERAVYNRERMVNLGLVPYVGSKLVVLSLIVGLQCLMLFGSLRVLHVAGLMKVPGDYYGIPQLLVMILTGIVGIALGLFISSIVKTSEMATSFVPLILIPQILFSGLVGVPKGPAKYVGAIMPAGWAFDEMKRLSSDLGVLRGKDEEAMPAAQNEGRGLNKDIKYRNDQLIEQKQKEMEDYKTKSADKFDDFDKEMNQYQKDMEKWNMGGRQGQEPKKPPKPTLDPVPPKVEVVPMPDDLSAYVDFLHPWGDKWLNALVLLMMFIGLTGGTIIALRSQDIG